MAQKISNLDVGYKVKITGSFYYGNTAAQPYEMIVAAKNHPGYPGGVVLISEYAVKRCAFDAAEPSNSDSDAWEWGNARYAHSNILQWLNSSESSWYTAKHSADMPPSSGDNPYANEKGFMSHFPASFNSLLLDVPAVTVVAGSKNTETVTSKWALPSITELFGTHEVAGVAEGSHFPYFNTDAKRKLTLPTGSTVDVDYFTRSPKSYSDGSKTFGAQLAAVMANGGIERMIRPSQGKNMIRPFCLISNDALVTDTAEGGYYSMVYNAVPVAPSAISVPTTINGGTSITVSWEAGSDSDGNLAGYVLERSVAGGAWTQIYRGALRSYIDSITFGWASVAYRVKTYDAYGAESAYVTSGTRTVNNNTAPTITGSDGNLGNFGGSFTAQSYTVNDAQGGTVTVVERVDGVVKRQYNATLGTAASFSFTAAEWQQVLNGTHTVTITATDSQGAYSVRTWTFTKAVNSLSFTITPLPADAMPDRCVVAVAGYFPSGSTLKIEVCNNANDASPRWEDVSAKLGKKHFFTNTSKTASAWAFGLRCSLNRGTAAGAAWLDYITINYR